ncbi:MAG: efflux RND transporter permease subunit [Gammaproteobacteria bacterium]|nr:efflux RND transporter permease subunit [Gammaproteobacteria bacterium]
MQEQNSAKLGISGKLAALFKQNQITPLLALVGFLLGLFAVLVTPREEEPQIEVTFANVFIPYTGASAAMVEQQVAIKAEKIIAEIAGVEHVYSVSEPGRAVLTVQFTVGEPRTEALVRLYNAFYAKADWQPADSNIGPVLIKPKSIDDVPVFALTLWSKNPAVTSADLYSAAKGLEEQLQRVPGSRDIYSIGGPAQQVLVRLNPAQLQAYQLSLPQLQQALSLSNSLSQSQAMLATNQQIQLQAGSFLTTPEQIGQLVVAVRQQDGQSLPVYLADVAEISLGSSEPQTYVQHLQLQDGKLWQSPALTIAVAKQPGKNAVDVTQALEQQLAHLQQHYLGQDIEVSISRNYGDTAKDKADTLIHKLLFATLSVVLLVGFALGWREAFVVGMAVIITLALTLFASWAYGFTLNRVSLFALIFSIGILVDDAIVVVENLHRHWLEGKTKLSEVIPLAVEEVGAPTILATFTVIAALLPMAFVSGLMGPYMSPIPINASMGMLISLLVAFIFTPWLFLKVFAGKQAPAAAGHDDSKLEVLFRKLMSPFLGARQGRGNRVWLLFGLLGAIGLSVLLVTSQQVVLKMLPFDNKSEFQVVVDLAEGSTLEQTQAVLNAVSLELLKLPEVTHLQTYAGTAAPINFNGLVRQYYLRQYPWQGDVQVNLANRHNRDEQSHIIALRVRPALAALEKSTGASIKLVEVPPGPPVMAPLVAEIYGPDYQTQLNTATTLMQTFAQADHVVDIDSTVEAPQPLWQLVVDQQKAAQLGVSVATVSQVMQMAVQGSNAGYLRNDHSRSLTPVVLKLQQDAIANWQQLALLPVPTQQGGTVALAEVTKRIETVRENTIYRKDLRPVVFVTADLAGGIDSPLYGMLDIKAKLADAANPIAQRLFSAPEHTDALSIKWDGEWQITFETFRDMGIAYGVGLIMIYLLVVAQFKSYGVPLMIMAPIPLTLIGIMPGHWLLNTQFTATSMIGMIALAGIIVRNSILLVDYIQQQLMQGVALEQAVVHASAVRARPIVLTGLAAMLGAFFILDDPIFGGLAVALIFGILVSTLLTLVVIPVVYYAYHYSHRP